MRKLNTESCLFVIFGATGDLMHRKLLPVLYQLMNDELLPARCRILGVGRDEKLADDRFRAQAQTALGKAGLSVTQKIRRWCDACLLVMPSGRSAHLEAGWAAGAGKRTAMVVLEPMEPELMVGMFDDIYTSIADLLLAPAWALAPPSAHPASERVNATAPPGAEAPAKSAVAGDPSP